MKGETYEQFVEKFKPKRTTDDCYTPPQVYETVLKWVRENIPQYWDNTPPHHPPVLPRRELRKPGAVYARQHRSGQSAIFNIFQNHPVLPGAFHPVLSLRTNDDNDSPNRRANIPSWMEHHLRKRGQCTHWIRHKSHAAPRVSVFSVTHRCAERTGKDCHGNKNKET